MICSINDCRKRHHTLVSASERILRKDGPGNREDKAEHTINRFRAPKLHNALEDRSSNWSGYQKKIGRRRYLPRRREAGTLTSEYFVILLSFNIAERTTKRFKTFNGRIVTFRNQNSYSRRNHTYARSTRCKILRSSYRFGSHSNAFWMGVVYGLSALTAAKWPVGDHSSNHMNFIDLTALVERFWLTDKFGKNPPKIPIRFLKKERAVTIINSTEM